MNTFLKINKKLLLIAIALIFSLFFITVLFNKLNFEKKSEDKIILSDPMFDIVNPSFTINNEKEKISVKASKGNFLNDDLILLQKNVSFESSNFKIFSDQVTFNRKKQTAKSESISKFKSKGTEIISEGFRIIEQGDIILFDGKTSLTLSQWD